MHIEDGDAFKAWLTAVLEPMCDADPAALAKYVFALVKKDKPIPELRTGMIEQLDVFLQNDTKKFVDLLFKTLETQVYTLPVATATPATEAVAPNLPAASIEPKQAEQHTQPQLSQVPAASAPVTSQPFVAQQVTLPTLNAPNSFTQSNGTVSSQHKHDGESGTRSHRKYDSDKDEKSRSGRSRHRSSSPSRNRSRSRSWERSRRSRSRERDRGRDRSRNWRNKSPPSRRHDRDRRHSWSRSNSPPGISRTRSSGNSRSRSRSPRYKHRGRYRNRSPPNRSITRSRSRSTDHVRDKKDPLSGAGTPTQDSNHGDVDMRLTTTSQSIQSVVSVGDKQTSGTSLLSNLYHAKRRCRDYDEKGYCMRGDLCPYDHGNDPVILEDLTLSRVLSFNPEGAPASHNINSAAAMSAVPGGTPALPIEPEAVVPPSVAVAMDPAIHVPIHPHHAHLRGPQPANMAEYNPDAPSMEPRMIWGRAPFRAAPPVVRGTSGVIRGTVGRPIPYNPQPQRELISVPVTDQTQNYVGYKRPRPTDTNNYVSHIEVKGSPPSKKKVFDFTRLGPRHKNPSNCSLELKKVPRGLNNITHLNNHFSKFGKIVNIQVCYEGDPEAAIITFSSHAEANAAYRSTEAVLNNRFIKVFWHNAAINEGKQENVPPPRPSVKERLGMPSSPSPANKVLNTLQPKAMLPQLPQVQEPIEKVIMSGNNLTKTVYIPTALKKPDPPSTVPGTIAREKAASAAAAVIKKTQEMLAVKESLKKKQEEKRKEALKLKADLRKRKQELLDEQISQQKQLIEKLEKGAAGDQRESIMNTIKVLQENIEKIRKDLSSVVTNTTASGVVRKPSSSLKKSKEEAQKELLDAELDLITKQQEGGDTSELQKKVAELRMEAHHLGLMLGGSSQSRRGSTHINRSLARGVSRISRQNSFRGRGRGFSHAHVSVDHRPTKILVSGYEEEEKLDVISHFTKFGEIVDYVMDDSTPSIILNYKSRKEAEVAMTKGRTFQDRLLSVTWCNNQPARPTRSNVKMKSTVLTHPNISRRSVILVGSGPKGEEILEGEDGLGEDEDIDDEEDLDLAEFTEGVLLQDDEEEEEDGEDRSWRR